MSSLDPNRVAVVVNSLLTYAGVERRTLELVEYLKGAGFDVEVCALRTVGKLAERYTALGVPVLDARVYDYTEGSGTYHFRAGAFASFWLHLLRRRFGVILCVQPPSSLFGRLAAFPTFGRRVIAMERFLTTGRSPRRKTLERMLARWTTDRIVCVSGLLRDELHSESGIPEDKIAVIEDGVGIEPMCDPQDALRSWIRGRFVFGYVGLLTERKRPRLVIEAFAEMLQLRGDDSVLILVGSGEQESELRACTAELSITDRVHFAGEQAHPHDFYRLFDSFVFPSTREGLGNVWAEAMLHELPVICADLRPMRDYISDGENGLLVPKDDRPALALAMQRLRDDPALRAELGRRGRDYALQHFDARTQLSKLVELFAPGRELSRGGQSDPTLHCGVPS